MRYTDEEVIFKYIDNDLALVKTANDLGMSHNTIRNILKKHEIEIHTPGHRTNVDKERIKKINSVEQPKTLENLTPILTNGSTFRHYKIGDKKDKLTVLMRKHGVGPTVEYIDKWDELFVECDCGEYKKMTYEEFINSTCCGCDNNG